MADKKITQFPTFGGAANDEVFFVVASGDTDNPNSSNYRYPFNSLTADITRAGSAWTTGTNSIYTLTGAVGLGTSAPVYQLDVATTGRFRDDLIVSGDLYVSGTTHVQKVIDVSITGTISGVTGEFTDGVFSNSLTISGAPVSTGGSIEVPGGGGSIIGGDVSNINFGGTEVSDTRAVNFQVGGVDKLVIGSDGNVSISEDLTVSGNVSGAIISGRSGVFSHSLTVSGQPVLTGTSSSLGKWSDGAGGDIYYNGGDVGIGTANPDARLEIIGSANAATVTGLKLTNSLANDNSEGVSLVFGGYDTDLMGSIESRMRNIDARSDLIFSTNSGLSATDIGERMRILSNGNVGIGVTSPSCNLETKARAGEEEVKLGLSSADGTQNAAIAHVDDGANERLSFRVGGFSAGVDKLTILNGGNVGIGTQTPRWELEILGSMAINSSGSNRGIWLGSGNQALGYIGSSDYAVNGLSTGDFGVSSAKDDASFTGCLAFGIGAVEKMRINSNGNVGIGTSAPSAKLSLPTNGSDPIAATPSDGIMMGNALNTYGLNLWHNNSGNTITYFDSVYDSDNSLIQFRGKCVEAAIPVEAMAIKGNGNVGIGITGAEAKLHVTGGKILAPSGDFSESLTISGNSVLTGAAGSVGGQWTDVVGLPNIYYNAGFVGIGIEPTSKLHLYGTSNNYADIVSETDANRKIQHWFKNAAQSWSIGTNGTTSIPGNSFFIKDETLGLRRLSILTDGKVGIGVDSPTAKLHVTGGKILAPSGDFTESLTISGVPVSTGNGDGEPAFSSDARLKDDVYSLSDSSEKIKQIRGVGFMWNENSSDGLRGREDVGVIAQEVQQILPSAVEEGSDGYLKVKYHRLIPLLLESVKDLQVENQKLQDRLNSAGL